MANPVLVEVTRGDLVESVHRGAVAIADASGLNDLPRKHLKGLTEKFGRWDDRYKGRNLALPNSPACGGKESLETEKIFE